MTKYIVPAVYKTSVRHIDVLDDHEMRQMLLLGASYLNPSDLPSILASPIALGLERDRQTRFFERELGDLDRNLGLPF